MGRGVLIAPYGGIKTFLLMLATCALIMYGAVWLIDEIYKNSRME